MIRPNALKGNHRFWLMIGKYSEEIWTENPPKKTVSVSIMTKVDKQIMKIVIIILNCYHIFVIYSQYKL